MDDTDREAAWRDLYYRKNELQIILGDAPFPDAVNDEIEKIEQKLREHEKILGYTPNP